MTGPTYGSLGWSRAATSCVAASDNRVDVAISRDIRMGGNRTLEFRLDVFNVFNTVIITNRQQPDQLQQPDRSDRPQLADAGRRLDRSGPHSRRATPASARRTARRPAQHADSVRFSF